MDFLVQVILLVVGFVMLVKGADWFVEGTSSIADRLGIPQIVIGLTIVAFGTSAPEAAISISAAMRGNADLTIGNVVGSNILNVLVILGITSILTSLQIQKNTFRFEIPFVVGISGLLLFLGNSDGVISRFDGIILWGLMILFLVYLFRLSKNPDAVAEEIPLEDKSSPMGKLLLISAIGGGLIVLGSDVTVDSATKIADMFGLSPRFIGLTIVAFGTSLPELITSVMAGIKGKADIAVGNIIGSNIFNILFVVGTTALITPVSFASNFASDTCVAILAVVILFVFVAKDKLLKRLGGILMLAAYAVYFVTLL